MHRCGCDADRLQGLTASTAIASLYSLPAYTPSFAMWPSYGVTAGACTSPSNLRICNYVCCYSGSACVKASCWKAYPEAVSLAAAGGA